MKGVRYRLLSVLPLLGLSVGVAAVLGLVNMGPKDVNAQQPANICRAVMVLDRSGSINPTQMTRMRSQIQRLFQPAGLYDDNIQLAFWTFANDTTINSRSYNNPYHGFVSSRGSNLSFNRELSSISSGGGTNYQQGFAYNGNTRNPTLNNIINATDIIVFMTDGQPNAPAGNAREHGRQAAAKHQNAGRVIIGGSVGGNNSQRQTINYVVSGDENNYANSFIISSNFNDLAEQLRAQIDKKCNELYPPCPYNPDIFANSPDCKPPVATPYTLIPRAISNDTIISGNESASFEYKVENQSTAVDSSQTDWSVKRVVVQRGQSTNGLTQYASGAAFVDDVSCDSLKARAGAGADCSDVASGRRIFQKGTITTLSTLEAGGAMTATLDDKWPVGTKLCYVLVLAKPTQNDTPVNRGSTAACVIVGRYPTFQVHGNDVIVGRNFTGDDISRPVANVRGMTTTKTIGGSVKTYGSWTEYGLFSSGAVNGVASGSSFSNGYEAPLSDRLAWSPLTFANTGGEYGQFAGNSGIGTVSNLYNYFVKGRTVAKDLTADQAVNFNGQGVASGVYSKTAGNLRIDASTLEKGKTIIVSVPNGTVTIAGDLTYKDDEYRAITEIPQLVILAANIVINENVGRVDGWLIAQDATGRGGRVDTCDKIPTSVETCETQLKINGPVVAKQLRLLRTGGSGAGGASGDPAETFNFRADSFLWGYNEGRSSVRATTTRTIELPPQF